MFKKKIVKKLPVEEVKSEESFPEVEIDDEEIEDEESEEEVEEEKQVNKEVKKPVKKSKYTPGDILPVQQVVGYQVVKSVSEDGVPFVTSTEKLSEAEILSFIYQQ